MAKLDGIDVHIDFHYRPDGRVGDGIALPEQSSGVSAQGLFGGLFGIGRRDFDEANAELGIMASILEMRRQGIPWEMIIAIVIQLITEWLRNRQPKPA